MKPKHILIVSLAYYPEFVGGAEVAIREITDRIAPSDVAFDLITLRFNSHLPKFEKIGNVNVYRVGFVKGNPSQSDLVRFPFYCNKILFPAFALWKAWRLDRKKHYDGIWAMMSYMGMVAVLIRTFVRKIPFVMSIQEGDDLKQVTGRLRIKLFLPILKKAFRDAVAIFAISNYLADWAKEMGAKGVVVIPNGVDVAKVKSQKEKVKSGEIRRKYGIEENEKVVITTSRLVHKNGVDILIRAMQFLPEDVKLLVVGNGPLLENLQLTTNNLQLGNRVFFADFVTQEKIPEYLYASDVFCRPSRTEGQGISFLEAMAAELPVVATPVGGIPDFLKDKETGLFARAEDPEDVARKIIILIRDLAEREIIVANARKMVEERYNWDDIAGRIKTLLLNSIS